jgi:Ni,Fe-hydrogenase III large subunit
VVRLQGIEKLLHGRTTHDGVELAERISGDTAVGHTLAYLSCGTVRKRSNQANRSYTVIQTVPFQVGR